MSFSMSFSKFCPSHPGAGSGLDSQGSRSTTRFCSGNTSACDAGPKGPNRNLQGDDEGGITEGDEIYAVHQYCVYVLCLHNCVILYIYIYILFIIIYVSIFLYVWLYVFALHQYMCECMHVYICSCVSYFRCLHIFAYQFAPYKFDLPVLCRCSSYLLYTRQYIG